MTDRNKEIEQKAYDFYLNVEAPNYDDERLYNAFIRGAKWSDSNPVLKWVSVKDKEVILPSLSKSILVTDGKKCSIVSVEKFLETVDKPFNEWTHWMKIPSVN